MDFCYALKQLRLGEKVTRAGWNGVGMWLEMQEVRQLPSGPLLLPHVLLSTATGDLVPWAVSQSDLLAHDWRRV